MTRVRTLVATEALLVFGLLIFVGATYFAELVGFDEPVALSPALALVYALIPAILWLAYFHAQDRHEPHPRRHVLGTYVLGALVAGPIAAFVAGCALGPAPLFTTDFRVLSPASALAAVAIVGLSQELSKVVVLRYGIYSTAELEEPLAGLVYATAVGIGFASYRTFQDLQALHGSVLLSAGAARAAVTTLAHVAFTGVTGYALVRVRQLRGSPRRRLLVLGAGLIVAATCNGFVQLALRTVSRAGIAIRPWRGVALAAALAAVVFAAVSMLLRRLPHTRAGEAEVDARAGEAEADTPAGEAKAGTRADAPARAGWRHGDLLLVGAALLTVFAAGSLRHHWIAPSDEVFHERGLRFEHPAGFLPAQSVARVASPLALGFERRVPAPSEPPPALLQEGGPARAITHLVYRAPSDPLLRLEVLIEPRPLYPNLPGSLAVYRASRYGSSYWSAGTELENIGGRDWTRTEFRYTYRSSPTDSPRVASAIEYATIEHGLLYVVTLHGAADSSARLAHAVAPSLSVSAVSSAPVSAPVPVPSAPSP